MNDNYFPKDQIVLTDREKQNFLETLPSVVSIDKGIKKAVTIVNAMPMFLTQSSCEGQNINEPNSTHMPVPYLSIGVLYNQFSLLNDLADYLWTELKAKIHSISLDYEVQAMNQHSETKQVVPNFQCFLSIFMKSKRGIPLLERALENYASPSLSLYREENEKITLDLANKYQQYTSLVGNIMKHSKLNTSLPPLALISKALISCKESGALSSVGVRKVVDVNYGDPLVVEFYMKDSSYSATDLLDVLCSYFTGDLICNESYQKTTSGNYLKKVHLSLLNKEKIHLFASILEHWGKVGTWQASHYWE